jgi:hypothetical protein
LPDVIDEEKKLQVKFLLHPEVKRKFDSICQHEEERIGYHISNSEVIRKIIETAYRELERAREKAG